MSDSTLAPAECPNCGRRNVIILPLHLEKGGPPLCLTCGMDWHAKHTRSRRAGRVAIKAMSLFLREGGRHEDLDKLKLRAICGEGVFRDFGRQILGYEADTIGAEVGDITTELLTDTIQLTHPDRHPAERRDLAHRVTEELLRLRPFTFPAPKPDPPVVPPDTRDGSEVAPPVHHKEPSRSTYPCETCADTIPHFYCDECKREWEMRQRKEWERDNAKRRAQYARRRDRRRRGMRPVTCLGCAAAVTSRRKDAKYCSHACRQRVYRGRGALKAVR
jgi:hypothetical protein